MKMIAEQNRISQGFTLKPQLKAVNQDYYDYSSFYNDATNFSSHIFVIADGMGGHQKGEVASFFAVQHIMKWWKALNWEAAFDDMDLNDITSQMVEEFHEINKRLVEISQIEQAKIGTTLTVLIIIDQQYVIVHIGDSAVYQFNKVHEFQNYDEETIDLQSIQGLSKLTLDHAKQIEKENQQYSSHILTQCMGVTGPIDPFVKIGTIEQVETFLIATDGLFKALPLQSIESTLNDDSTFDDKIDQLYKSCSASELKDDVTMMLVSCV